MAIPPHYLDEYVIQGVPITIRTLRPTDRDAEQRFISNLSPQTSYFRFHGTMRELPADLLDRFMNSDYPDEMALIATVNEEDGPRQVAVARFVRVTGTETAELAIVVADDWQGRGLGTRMLEDLRHCAIEAGIQHFQASVLAENRRMVALCRRLGFDSSSPRTDFQTRELGKQLQQDSGQEDSGTE